MNKKNIVLNIKKHLLACIIILILILLVLSFIYFLWFNNKLNRITKELKKDTTVTSNISSKSIKYGNLYKVPTNYEATKQYLFYSDASIENSKKAKIDEQGIALKANEKDYVYNPTIIAQYGLEQYGNYIETSNEEYYKKAKLQADYLVKVQDKSNGKFYYDYDFKVAGTNQTMKSPWASAMAQGQAISLLARIYYVSHDKQYLESAQLAMSSLTKKVEDGGLYSDFFGYKYYEEYPTTPASYTLNGFMFTLLGLHDLYSISKDKQAKELYSEGIKTLEYCLPFYDSIGISLYHLGHLTDKELPLHYDEGYHRIHIVQLKVINQFEKNKVFEYYSSKWEKYVKESK